MATAVEKWETGEGKPLFFGNMYLSALHTELLRLIMPKVTTVCVNEEGYIFLFPPTKGWVQTLTNWKTFIKDDLNWGLFAEYRGVPDNTLLISRIENIGLLNLAHKEKFSGFSDNELQTLFKILNKATDALSNLRKLPLDSGEAQILDKACKVAGDLTVMGIGCVYSLRQFIGGNSNPKDRINDDM